LAGTPLIIKAIIITYVGDDDDECDEDECPSGGICVARGNFAARKCLKSG